MKRFCQQLPIISLIAWLGLAGCSPESSGATPVAATAVAGPTTADPTPTPGASPTNRMPAQTGAPTPDPPRIEVEPPAKPTAVPTTAITATDVPPTATNLPPTQVATAVPLIEVAGASVPPGFSFIKFADVFRPTGLAFDAAGRLFVTSFDGTIHILSDLDGDGRADSDTLFASGFEIPLGLTFRPGTSDLYVSSTGQVSLLRDENQDGTADSISTVIGNLPTGLHQNDNPEFGPDGWLYLGIGSTCDACFEPDQRSATIMRFNVDSGENEIIATGLRNPFDLAFHPATGELFATDNGRDDLGLDSPFEELNLILNGADYGWPNCWNAGEGPDCSDTETAVAFFEPHSSANGLLFYTGHQFPPAYQQDAFVTIFGTFLTDGVATGIARVELIPTADGYQSSVTWFAQWPNGRPLPLVVGPDGALYVGDYINSVIYRISYGQG